MKADIFKEIHLIVMGGCTYSLSFTNISAHNMMYSPMIYPKWFLKIV